MVKKIRMISVVAFTLKILFLRLILLCLYCKSQVTPKWFPCKSLVSPIFRPFYGTDLERFWSEPKAKVERRHNEGATKASLPLILVAHFYRWGKKDFGTTLQLITRSVVMLYASDNCGGDSFESTRHPLITLIWDIVLIQSELQRQFTRHLFLGDEWWEGKSCI